MGSPRIRSNSGSPARWIPRIGTTTASDASNRRPPTSHAAIRAVGVSARLPAASMAVAGGSGSSCSGCSAANTASTTVTLAPVSNSAVASTSPHPTTTCGCDRDDSWSGRSASMGAAGRRRPARRGAPWSTPTTAGASRSSSRCPRRTSRPRVVGASEPSGERSTTRSRTSSGPSAIEGTTTRRVSGDAGPSAPRPGSSSTSTRANVDVRSSSGSVLLAPPVSRISRYSRPATVATTYASVAPGSSGSSRSSIGITRPSVTSGVRCHRSDAPGRGGVHAPPGVVVSRAYVTMSAGRRRAGQRSANPRRTVASRAASEMAAVRQPFVSSRPATPRPCTEAPVAFSELVPAGMPYGPLAFTGVRGPAGTMPYGPLAFTVLGRPAGTMPYGPLAFTVLGRPAGTMPYGPLAVTVLPGPAGSMPSGPRAPVGVPSDAPAADGIAKHRAQTPVAMQRVSMVTSRGLEIGAADRSRRNDALGPALRAGERDRWRRRWAIFQPLRHLTPEVDDWVKPRVRGPGGPALRTTFPTWSRALPILADDAEPNRLCRSLAARAHVELAQDRSDVVGDGPLREHEAPGDIGVACTLRGELEHLTLTSRQVGRIVLGRRPWSSRQSARAPGPQAAGDHRRCLPRAQPVKLIQRAPRRSFSRLGVRRCHRKREGGLVRAPELIPAARRQLVLAPELERRTPPGRRGDLDCKPDAPPPHRELAGRPRGSQLDGESERGS